MLSEANDSSGINNANMSTPPDGSPPRMQQYLFDWNGLGNRVSSSDSADVVFHEYTHGLSNRLVGNASGLGAQQSGAMGEGWSDWYANDFLVATGEKTDGPGIDLRLGEYATGTGIRNQPMDCNPDSAAASCPANASSGTGGFTFGDLGTFNANGVHDNGEIWSQTLWDLRERVGVFNARAIITDGLRLTPVDPTFLQARDAILQAAAGPRGSRSGRCGRSSRPVAWASPRPRPDRRSSARSRPSTCREGLRTRQHDGAPTSAARSVTPTASPSPARRCRSSPGCARRTPAR